VLVGFDFVGSHFFGEHPKAMRITSPWDQLALHMAPLASALAAQGCEVINCSPISALRYWPKKSLAEALDAG
jgi:hypothetical protein